MSCANLHRLLTKVNAFVTQIAKRHSFHNVLRSRVGLVDRMSRLPSAFSKVVMDTRAQLVFLVYLSSVHGYLFKDCHNSSDYSVWYRCDGYNECLNGADELNCKQEECRSNLFWSAVDGKCVSKDFICDGFVDTSDAIDESRCTLPVRSKRGCNCNDTFEYMPLSNTCQPIKLCQDNYCAYGGAKHQCIDVPGAFRCQCAEGYHNWDPMTCLKISDVEPLALEARPSSISLGRFNEVRNEIFPIRSYEPGQRCMLIHQLEYNFAHNYIVWLEVDSSNATFYAGRMFKDRNSSLPGQDEIRLFSPPGGNYQIAIDWIHDNIYFIDAFPNAI